MNDPNSIPDLIRQLRDEGTTLVRDEFALAKTEMKEKAALAGRNIGYLAAGALVGYSALVIFLIGLGYLVSKAFIAMGIDATVALFLGFLLVALVVGIIGAALVSKALKTLKEESFAPERTVETLKNDKKFVEQQTTKKSNV